MMRRFLIEVACILLGIYLAYCSGMTGWYVFELRTTGMFCWSIISVAIGVLPYFLAEFYYFRRSPSMSLSMVGSEEPLNQFHV
jgi:hypothetical protein